jgi:Mn-dependent DtxR family transcriptional regulator
LGVKDENILSETEKVEHTLSDETIKCFENYISFIKDNPEVQTRLKEHRLNESKLNGNKK